MKIYKTTPWFIEFDANVLDTLVDYAYANGYEKDPDIVYVEDEVSKFFEIELDYNEDKDLYVIYFDSDADMTMFTIKYSELL